MTQPIMETLKQFCPLNLIKNIGSEVIWLFQTAQTVKDMVGEMTFQDWDDSPAMGGSQPDLSKNADNWQGDSPEREAA